MPEDDHRHCKVCGKVIVKGEKVCSASCRETMEANARTRQNTMYLMYGGLAFILFLLVVGAIRL
jgi:predicted nucleic acid-binding Zn ribbon protein